MNTKDIEKSNLISENTQQQLDSQQSSQQTQDKQKEPPEKQDKNELIKSIFTKEIEKDKKHLSQAGKSVKGAWIGYISIIWETILVFFYLLAVVGYVKGGAITKSLLLVTIGLVIDILLVLFYTKSWKKTAVITTVMILTLIIVHPIVLPVTYYTFSPYFNERTYECVKEVPQNLGYPSTLLITPTVAITPDNKYIIGNYSCLVDNNEAFYVHIGFTIEQEFYTKKK